MTDGTNKEWSIAEINEVILGDTNLISLISFHMPKAVLTPFALLYAAYFVFGQIGGSGLIMLVFIALRITLQ